MKSKASTYLYDDLAIFCPVSQIPYQGQCLLNKIIDMVGRMKDVQYSSIRLIENQSSIFVNVLWYRPTNSTYVNFVLCFEFPIKVMALASGYRYMVGRMKDAQQYYTLIFQFVYYSDSLVSICRIHFMVRRWIRFFVL